MSYNFGNQGNNNYGNPGQPPGMDYLSKVPPLFDQYNQTGQKMASDPAGYMNELMSKYQPSEAYKLMLKELTQQQANTAAAGGQRGSQYDVAQTSDITNRLMQGDMQQWLQNTMGVQQSGAQQGLQAAGDIGNAYGSMGGMEFEQWRQKMADEIARQQMENESDDSWMGAAGKLIGGVGGFMLGGPAGAYAGANLGSQVPNLPRPFQ